MIVKLFSEMVYWVCFASVNSRPFVSEFVVRGAGSVQGGGGHPRTDQSLEEAVQAVSHVQLLQQAGSSLLEVRQLPLSRLCLASTLPTVSRTASQPHSRGAAEV